MSNLSEMKQMANGAIVNEFVGTVSYVNDPTVHPSYGKSQRITMIDEAGENVSVTLSDAHANFTIAHKDQKFIAKSKPTAAHGMQGVKINKNGEYTNLKITNTAVLTNFETGGALPATAAPAASPQAASSAPAQSGGMDHEELAAKMVGFAVQLGKELTAVNMPDHIKDAMVIKAPEYAALWWFGQKDLNWKPEVAPQTAGEVTSPPEEDDAPW